MTRHSRTMHVPWLAIIVGTVAACATPAPAGSAPACGLAPADTTGWRTLASQQQVFAITLPAEAQLVRLPCVDSPCGEIRVGEMVIAYDSGPLAGPGTELTPTRNVAFDRECRVGAGAREFLVALGRYTADTPAWGPTIAAPDTIPAGTRTVQAVHRISDEGGGLYFYMRSPHPADQPRFVSALATVRVHEPAP